MFQTPPFSHAWTRIYEFRTEYPAAMPTRENDDAIFCAPAPQPLFWLQGMAQPATLQLISGIRQFLEGIAPFFGPYFPLLKGNITDALALSQWRAAHPRHALVQLLKQIKPEQKH